MATPRTSHKLTDTRCRTLPKPDKGNRLYFDRKYTNLALRVTAAGARSWVLCYRLHGPERRVTIGRFPGLSAELARDEAKRIEVEQIRNGIDPIDAKQGRRKAYTLAQWGKKYIDDHAKPTKRPGSVAADERHVRLMTKHFGKRKRFGEITSQEVRKMHQAMKDTPRQANKVLATLSHMFTCAIADGVDGITVNPVRGIKRHPEEGRERFLHGDELERFVSALAALTRETRQAIDEAEGVRKRNKQVRYLTQYRLIEFMLLTGARRGETERARWSDVDFELNRWTKPSHHTKQKKRETVPLSAAAVQLLKTWRKEPKRSDNSQLIFPGALPDHWVDYPRETWATLLKRAELDDLRPHDLRHTYASQLVMAGLNLPVIQKLMGHTTAVTTQKYAHLADDPLREATEVMGGLVGKLQNGKKRPRRRKGGKK